MSSWKVKEERLVELTRNKFERSPLHAFLSAIMDTAPMKYCHQYCLVKDASYEGRSVPRNENVFVKILETMWFELYSRSGCGFEHVFVGEVSESAGALFST